MTDETPRDGFRTFVIAWASQSVSMIGTALTFFAVSIWLTTVSYPLPAQKPRLAFALTAAGLAFALPAIFGAPIAGAWADRHDRRRTMIAMNLASGALTLAMIALMLGGRLTLPWLLGLLALYFLAGAFHAAAFDSSYAMLVTPAELPRANGMMQTIWALSGVVSPGIAAALIALPAMARQGRVPGPLGAWLGSLTQGVPLALGLDAATFLLSALVLAFLHIPSPKRLDRDAAGRPRTSLLGDVRLGWVYIWHRRPLLWLLGTFAMANLIAGPGTVLQPLLVKFNLAPDWRAHGFRFETALALIATVNGVGGIVGGAIVTMWGGLRSRRVLGVLVPLVLAGLLEIGFGLSPWLSLSSAIGFMVGMLLPAINVHSQAIWQTQVPRELQGRVFAVRRLIAQCTFPLGTVIGGWLGGVVDPGLALAGIGAVLVVFAFAQFFNPLLLKVEDKAYLDALAEAEVGRPGPRAIAAD